MMKGFSLVPFYEESFVVQLHLVTALLMMVLGGVQLVRPKGGNRHRLLGQIWVAGMAIIALSGLFIHKLKVFGLISPIHLLSLLTLYFLFIGVMAARNGQIKRHQIIMKATYFLALILTGFFTFFPGRLMDKIFFGTGL